MDRPLTKDERDEVKRRCTPSGDRGARERIADVVAEIRARPAPSTPDHADLVRLALEEAAKVAIARRERNESCPPECKCADASHVAAAIRALADSPAVAGIVERWGR